MSIRQATLVFAGLLLAAGSPFSAADELAVHKPAPGKKLLVPPPPPEIPLMGAHGEESLYSTMGMPLEYMSRTDLEAMEKRLETQEEHLKRRAADREQSLKEQQDRVASFEELYKEGVVSRKELERAHRDLSDLQDHGSELQTRAEDTQSDIERVKKQLAVLDKKAAVKAALASKRKPPVKK